MRCEHEFHWYMAPATEDGWKCAACGFRPGEVPGYSAELDEKLIDRKVFAVLDDLHNAAIIYVSNGAAGEGIVHSVAESCRADRCFDQVTIAARILGGGEADDSHAKFWRERGDAIRAGGDPYNRCHCGKIANASRSKPGGGWTHTCSEHLRIFSEDGAS